MSTVFKSLCNVYRVEMRSPGVNNNKKCLTLRRIIFRPPGKLSFPPAVSERHLPVVRKTSADLLERKRGGRTENHKQSRFQPGPFVAANGHDAYIILIIIQIFPNESPRETTLSFCL